MAVDLQTAKAVVRAMHAELDVAAADDIEAVLARHMTSDWLWRGMHPFYEQTGAAAVAETFWKPLRAAFSPVQRRSDVFFAGINEIDDGASTWVVEMGHLLGLFDQPWLDIPATGRMCFVRYAEFNRVNDDGCIDESSMFVDIPDVMVQAGQNPFPPQTGSHHLYPGPRSHDGLLYGPSDATEGPATLALVNEMINDLGEANRIANETGVDAIPIEVMQKTWADDMIWSGPAGIGASYTIDRYQQQHSYPFRFHLTDKVFIGHTARFAEGNYAGFFGWANLSNRATGGFLGMPASTTADMRVVDIYRREGDRLAENWVIIDLLHWLSMQGLDVLERMRQLNGQARFDE